MHLHVDMVTVEKSTFDSGCSSEEIELQLMVEIKTYERCLLGLAVSPTTRYGGAWQLHRLAQGLGQVPQKSFDESGDNGFPGIRMP